MGARLLKFGGTARPLNPPLARVVADTGVTKVRDHRKPVGSDVFRLPQVRSVPGERGQDIVTSIIIRGHIGADSDAQGRHTSSLRPWKSGA